MGKKDHERAVRQWLETAEAQALLLKIAESIYGEIRGSPSYFSKLFPDLLPSDPKKEALEILRAELVVFILEKKPSIRSGDENTARYLRQSFRNRLLDKMRKPGVNPFGYLYKRAREVLKGSGKFHTTFEKGKGSFFSLRPDAQPVQPLSEEDLTSIPFPDRVTEIRDFDAVKKKKALLDLAVYFMDQVCSLYGVENAKIAIREFVYWIGIHVPLALPQRVKNHAEKDLLENYPDEHTEADRGYFNPKEVKLWAEKFSNTLDRKEKTVFYLHFGAGFGFKEIAEKTGYAGASGPAYVLDLIKHKLKVFLADLRWLSADDLNEEAFAVFKKTLLGILKKSAKEP
ncbi:MAG: hypothetical protein JRH18_24135 [Deltaproteobacteria bacterium]|nr:hypothetical protein [Deltaproteobacteria bacterium]MBW2154738.1 hypothetical protein [Deltaproteobacteria bacterium]